MELVCPWSPFQKAKLKEMGVADCLQDIAGTYLQPHYGNGVFSNVYLSAGQHLEVNIACTPLP